MTTYEHVDEWLDAPTTDEAELPAKLWLEKFRAPAWKKDEAWLAAHKLTCRHKGKVYRVIGCSAMGDIWLRESLTGPIEFGDKLRVSISNCGSWYMTMVADPYLVDLDGPWRATTDNNVTGVFMPVVVDCCNTPLFSAHCRVGVIDRIVADHNTLLKPFKSALEDDVDDADADLPTTTQP